MSFGWHQNNSINIKFISVVTFFMSNSVYILPYYKWKTEHQIQIYLSSIIQWKINFLSNELCDSASNMWFTGNIFFSLKTCWCGNLTKTKKNLRIISFLVQISPPILTFSVNFTELRTMWKRFKLRYKYWSKNISLLQDSAIKKLRVACGEIYTCNMKSYKMFSFISWIMAKISLNVDFDIEQSSFLNYSRQSWKPHQHTTISEKLIPLNHKWFKRINFSPFVLCWCGFQLCLL